MLRITYFIQVIKGRVFSTWKATSAQKEKGRRKKESGGYGGISSRDEPLRSELTNPNRIEANIKIIHCLRAI